MFMFSGRDFLLSINCLIVDMEQLLFFLYNVALCGLVRFKLHCSYHLPSVFCIELFSSLVQVGAKNRPIVTVSQRSTKYYTTV